MRARFDSIERLELASGYFAVGRVHAPEPGSHPPVVVLHGFPDHPPTLLGFARGLAAHGHDVAVPWLRGYGPSTLTGPYDLGALTTDLFQLVDRMFPATRVHLVGHDWGAAITYAACALQPARFLSAATFALPHPLAFFRNAVVQPAQLLRSHYMLAFQVPRVPERLLLSARMRWVDALWERWSPGLRLDPEEREALHACLAASLPGPIEYYRAMVRPVGPALALLRGPAARPIAVPTLHVQGHDDGCIAPPACRGQERFFTGPFASEVEPGVGHFLLREAPERLAARTAAWFAAHPENP